jgi:hypothetical protein
VTPPPEAAAEPGPGAPPSPDADLPPLDADQVEVLKEVGREWAPAFDRGAASLRVDPSLHRPPEVTEPTRWGRLVHVMPAGGSAEELQATSDGDGRVRVRQLLFGLPLKSSAIVKERMRKLVALPVLSADALSSVAYGPEAMLAILVLAGGAGLGWSLPVSAAIACLMLAVGFSYRQTIRAYPHGGGSYIVATKNLGQVAGLVAAAGLATSLTAGGIRTGVPAELS